MVAQTLRIATRKSPLALWQAHHVGSLLKSHWPKITIQLIPLVTSGDRFMKNKLQALGGKGLFVKELEEALLDERADIAVHSMKDVPAYLPEGLQIAAICKRDNPFDAFVSCQFSHLAELPPGSVIGTTSLRRQSQLLALRDDWVIQSLRGNIHTRLAKLENGEFDAIILAAAGLERMGITKHVRETIPEEHMLPACGQGALGIECKSSSNELLDLLAPLHDASSALCVNAERRVNALLGGNCHAPLAVFCTKSQDELHLRARLLNHDGQTAIASQQSGHHSQMLQLANDCANDLFAQGARQLMSAYDNH